MPQFPWSPITSGARAFAPRRLCAAILATAAAVLPASARADMVATKTFSYFAVHGSTAEELDRGLARGGPLMKSTGARHPGATRIKFGGTVSYVTRKGGCAVGTARVTLSTKIILPRWTNRKRASRDLALVWDTLAADIKRHEERHAEIARNHARDLERALNRLRPEASCAALQARVSRLSQEAVEAHDRDQARFDRTEAANFDRRILRLLQHRLNALKAER
ncbi:DUF922 domain-containing Zn-dependent protease [Ensifer soli]|uniref:DUF922 domain-containing Zn-dependent protease n=1 Tax=Ciceribacter sp. sgz301302 TaxID=3342379 RepID=UPI0035B8151F